MDRIFSIGNRSSRVRSFESPRVIAPEAGRRIWVCDSVTREFLPSEVSSHDPCVVLSPGESAKNWDSVMKILDAALDIPLGRDGTVVALGGGVVCDLAAFAASIYMRGCRLILIPTTLLAMVDASLGGKTGIDYREYKNIVGSFYPAEEIHLYAGLLRSLPEKEYRSGLAEVLKHALLAPGTLFEELKLERTQVLERSLSLLNDLIPRSLMVKAKIVEEDPTEQGIRAHLNLGHTFGHALESVLGLGAVPHGYAVAWGIARAMEAGVALGETDPSYAEQVKTFLESYDYDLAIRIPDLDVYLQRIRHDKKSRDGRVRFVLQRRLGETFTGSLEEDLLRAVLQAYSS